MASSSRHDYALSSDDPASLQGMMGELFDEMEGTLNGDTCYSCYCQYMGVIFL